MGYWRSFAAFVALSVVCLAQSLPPELASKSRRWDATHGVLFFGRGTLNRNEPIRSYDFISTNLQRASDINLFKDFPSVQDAIVIDEAAGIGDSTVLSVVLDFGSKALRHVILTYASNGALRSIVDTEPYMSWAITTDERGNVFALGDKLLGEETAGNPYPLVREYDPNGALIAQFLYSNSFQDGARAIDPGNGRDVIYPVLSLRRGKLYIYAPVANEFLICTTTGTVVRRESLGKIRAQVAAQDKVEFAGMRQVAFMDDAHIVLSLQEYPAGSNLVMPPKAYLVNLNTQGYLALDLPPGAQVIGATEHDLLTLNPSPDNKASIKHLAISPD